MKIQIKKTFVVLLVFLLATNFFVAMAAAAPHNHHQNDHQHRGHHHQNQRHHNGHGKNKAPDPNSADYKLGEKDGANAGFTQGHDDFNAGYVYEQNYDDRTPSAMGDDYIAGFEDGYQRGYDRGFQ
jgi:hypothetical protein